MWPRHKGRNVALVSGLFFLFNANAEGRPIASENVYRISEDNTYFFTWLFKNSLYILEQRKAMGKHKCVFERGVTSALIKSICVPRVYIRSTGLSLKS